MLVPLFTSFHRPTHHSLKMSQIIIPLHLENPKPSHHASSWYGCATCIFHHISIYFDLQVLYHTSAYAQCLRSTFLTKPLAPPCANHAFPYPKVHMTASHKKHKKVLGVAQVFHDADRTLAGAFPVMSHGCPEPRPPRPNLALVGGSLSGDALPRPPVLMREFVMRRVIVKLC